MLLAAPLLVSGQEKIVLGTPIVPASISEYTPRALLIQPQLSAPIVQSPYIRIELLRADGRVETFEYPCRNGCTAMDTDAKVQNVIQALNNTVNMSTRSLWRRVFDRLVADFPERFSGGGTVQ